MSKNSEIKAFKEFCNKLGEDSHFHKLKEKQGVIARNVRGGYAPFEGIYADADEHIQEGRKVSYKNLLEERKKLTEEVAVLETENKFLQDGNDVLRWGVAEHLETIQYLKAFDIRTMKKDIKEKLDALDQDREALAKKLDALDQDREDLAKKWDAINSL